MYRTFNFQTNIPGSDPTNQLNWQSLNDSTKSSQYTPTTTGISSVNGVFTEGYYTLYGPWVLVRALVFSGGAGALTGATGTVGLPFPIVSADPTGATYKIQYLPVTLNTGTILGGLLVNNTPPPANNQGLVQITAAMLGTATSLYISGIYLRN